MAAKRKPSPGKLKLTPEEQAVIDAVVESRGQAWAKANIDLILDQARAIGDLSEGARVKRQRPSQKPAPQKRAKKLPPGKRIRGRIGQDWIEEEPASAHKRFVVKVEKEPAPAMREVFVRIEKEPGPDTIKVPVQIWTEKELPTARTDTAAPLVYTLEEAAALLKLHPQTVYRYIREGKLRAAKFGRVWRITPANLAAFIASQERR